jgi:hypothetical protein
VVEVGASGKLLPACVTAVEEGMEVTARSDEELERFRARLGRTPASCAPEIDRAGQWAHALGALRLMAGPATERHS